MRNRRNTRNNKIKEFLTNKRFLQITSILLIIILASVGVIGYKSYKNKQTLAKEKEELEKQTEEIFSSLENGGTNNEKGEGTTSTNEEEKSSSVSLSIVGDILCGDEMISDAKNDNDYDFSNMFANVLTYTKSADLSIGTLETNFTDNQYSGIGKYNAPIAFLKAIKNTGIDLVSVAHNHELDYGVDGLNTTVQKIQSEGIDVTGIKNSANLDFTGKIKEVNNVKIAVLGYTYGLSNESELSSEEKDNANIYSEEKVSKDIEYAKANSNYIIVIMHWGEVNDSDISEWQNNVTDYLVSEGVDMILGSHPSVIEPMEIKQNKDGKNVLVAYSLGNYISSLKYENADVELVLNVTIYKKQSDEKAFLQKVDYTPIYVLDNGKKSDNRFELYNMKTLAINYTDGNTEKISKLIYNKLINKLSWLNEIIINK